MNEKRVFDLHSGGCGTLCYCLYALKIITIGLLNRSKILLLYSQFECVDMKCSISEIETVTCNELKICILKC
jgi:hypothetical protein